MTRSRQPVSTATYRNYGVAVPIDPIDGPLYPGCEIKFPMVAGGPPEGIIRSLPRSWGADKEMLIFKLKLNKAGATEDTVTIASALYREPRVDTDEGEDEMGEVDLTAHESSIHPSSPVQPAAEEGEAEAATEDEDTVDAAAAAEEGAMEAEAAADDEDTVEATAAAEDEDTMEVEAKGEAEESVAEGVDGEGSDDELPLWVLDQTGGGAAVNTPAAHTDDEDDGAPSRGGAAINTPAAHTDDEDDGAPSPPPLPPAPPLVVPRASSRQLKRKQRFGDNGEFESRFRSAPPSRKASLDPSVETCVPAYALAGKQVWAMGLRAGVRMRFKASVIKLRSRFPRIVVKYTATEDDETSRHVLPDVLTAYLHMGDVNKRDW
jgi:hypothetical protein